jgi:hypothetical protein
MLPSVHSFKWQAAGESEVAAVEFSNLTFHDLFGGCATVVDNHRQ